MKKKITSSSDAAWDEVQGNKKASALMGQMAQDAGERENAQEVPGDAKMKELANQIGKMRALERSLAELAEKMQLATEQYNTLRGVVIPDLFDELGMKSFTLTDGTKAEVDRSFASSITEENKPAAFKWLKKNGHEAIIKHDVVVKLKKGEEEIYKAVTQDLDILGASYDDKEYVHPQTLKAFVKEQMTQKSSIPQDAFGIYPIRVTKITAR